MRILTVLFWISCWLAAAEPKERMQVEHTERADFPPGGMLSLKNSVGEVTVEGWDRPDVEITTIKSIYASRNRQKASHNELDKVRVSVDRRADELVITTDFPRRRNPPSVSFRSGEDFGSLKRLFTSPASIVLAASFDLEYRIKAPMNARLAADHDTGEVHVDNLTSDIHVTVLNGGITLHLPQEGQYTVDAKSDVGGVNSNLPGRTKRRPWLLGQQFVQRAPAAHKLYLRVGVGDITILRIQRPSTPGPPSPREKAIGASVGP